MDKLGRRFSLEGGEAIIAGRRCDDKGADMGVENYFGIAHRGRLNVLTNIMQKPYEQVFIGVWRMFPIDDEF
jgi:2-oxoglutarate dehydrogenase E1 component